MAKDRRYRKTTMEKAARVRAIVERYHERGNHRRSYPMIHRTYVYPVYPMSLRTMMHYLMIARGEADTSPEVEAEPARGLYPLFDAWDAERHPWDT
ncbi:hypothetical protein [Porphyromonas catoniae]|nr:hypothetical protein [Porphyromonas catoniae]